MQGSIIGITINDENVAGADNREWHKPHM